MSRAGRARSNQAGFSYAIVLVAVVVVGILAEGAHLAMARVLRADREAELLFRGQTYRRAIQSYYEAGSPVKTYPASLEYLLHDPRSPGRRHIRALYEDPFAEGENKQWNIVRAPDGGISGIASASREEPLKQANFPRGLETFSVAKTYSDWIFEYRAGVVAIPLSSRPTQPLLPK